MDALLAGSGTAALAIHTAYPAPARMPSRSESQDMRVTPLLWKIKGLSHLQVLPVAP